MIQLFYGSEKYLSNFDRIFHKSSISETPRADSSSQRIWDFTTIDTFLTCRRKYYYWGVRHLQPKTKALTLLFGGAVHSALDEWYLTHNLEKTLKVFHAEYDGMDRETDALRTLENGLKLMQTYTETYPQEPFKVIGKPEKGFVFPIGDIMYGGRMDLLVEWDEALWVMEHKTTSRITYSYFNQFELDKQITGYIIAAETYTGKKCIGCLLNVLEPWKEVKRVSAKTKKPEEHLQRFPVTRSSILKKRFKLNLQRIIRDILWCEKNNEFIESEKKEVCTYYNSSCPYKELCLYGEDEHMIREHYIIEEWKPYDREGGK